MRKIDLVNNVIIKNWRKLIKAAKECQRLNIGGIYIKDADKIHIGTTIISSTKGMYANNGHLYNALDDIDRMMSVIEAWEDPLEWEDDSTMGILREIEREMKEPYPCGKAIDRLNSLIKDRWGDFFSASLKRDRSSSSTSVYWTEADNPPCIKLKDTTINPSIGLTCAEQCREDNMLIRHRKPVIRAIKELKDILSLSSKKT